MEVGERINGKKLLGDFFIDRVSINEETGKLTLELVNVGHWDNDGLREAFRSSELVALYHERVPDILKRGRGRQS